MLTWAWGPMSDAFDSGRLGVLVFRLGNVDRLARVTPAPVLNPGSPLLPATPALVAHAQGDLTLGQEPSELGAGE